MIVGAIVLLAVAAAVPLAVTAARLRITELGRRPVEVDVATCATLLLLICFAALLAIPHGDAANPSAVIARILALIAAVTGGGPVVRSVLAAAGVVGRRQRALEEGDSDHDVADPDVADPDSAGPLRGGRVIGYLERLAVAATLLAGWPEGLAIILAVKSLARYPELRAPHASEQFIMGTFASVLWAVAMVGIGRLILT